MQTLHVALAASTASRGHALSVGTTLFPVATVGSPTGLAGNGHFGKSPQMTDSTRPLPEKWKELETWTCRYVEPALGASHRLYDNVSLCLPLGCLGLGSELGLGCREVR